MPLALRPLALAGSALAHGLAAWALLQAPAAPPPDPPVLMDLAMPAPEVAEAQAAPSPAPSAEAAGATPQAAAPDPVAPEAPQAEAGAPPEEAPPPSWLGDISAALGRHRAYPARLRAERVTDVVLLRFTVDRAGQVLARQVERSSGHPELDALALDLLVRAAPLPPPPGDLPGQRIELVVPVRYALR